MEKRLQIQVHVPNETKTGWETVALQVAVLPRGGDYIQVDQRILRVDKVLLRTNTALFVAELTATVLSDRDIEREFRQILFSR